MFKFPGEIHCRVIFAVLLMTCLPVPGLVPPVQAQDRIVLGAPTSLNFLEGRESLNAARLAVKEINQKGGVLLGGKRVPFDIRTVDLRDAVPGEDIGHVLHRLDRFIRLNKPDAIIIGPFRSEVLLAGMEILSDHKLPCLGAIAMSSATESKVLRNPRYKYIFRVGLDAKYLVDYLIGHMKFLRRRFGFRRVFIMNQDVAWARSTSSMVMRLYFNRTDWQVLGQKNYASSWSDFSQGLAEAESKGAQIILTIFDTPQSGNLVRQWRRMKVPALLTGFISPIVGPGAWEAFDREIAGALSMVFELGNMPSRKYAPAQTFYDAYHREYGREIQAGHGPAPAYESIYILAQAIERAGTLDPDKLAAALEQTDRIGAMGRIRFHRGHQAIFGRDTHQEAVACLIQWTREGKRRIVYPESLAEGEITISSSLPE